MLVLRLWMLFLSSLLLVGIVKYFLRRRLLLFLSPQLVEAVPCFPSLALGPVSTTAVPAVLLRISSQMMLCRSCSCFRTYCLAVLLVLCMVWLMWACCCSCCYCCGYHGPYCCGMDIARCSGCAFEHRAVLPAEFARVEVPHGSWLVPCSC